MPEVGRSRFTRVGIADPNSPIGLEPEPNGVRINMGAYGGTAEASMTYYPGPIWGIASPGDACNDPRSN